MDGTFAERERQTYDEIVVVGGGCYGTYYVRQLARAARAGALAWSRLLVVDRNAECAVFREPGVAGDLPSWASPVEVVREWGEFLSEWLSRPGAGSRDAIVPSPLMPHVFFEDLERRARGRWPDRLIGRAAPGSHIGAPWERGAPDGTAYVSHATWTCPINCIEPSICPHTRAARSWTMPETLATWADARRAAGEPLLGPFTFLCTHRAFGVGMVDRAPISEADGAIARAGATGAVRAVIATASHCHGAAAVLAVEAPRPDDGVRATSERIQ